MSAGDSVEALRATARLSQAGTDSCFCLPWNFQFSGNVECFVFLNVEKTNVLSAKQKTCILASFTATW